jgi:hypothetical protein
MASIPKLHGNNFLGLEKNATVSSPIWLLLVQIIHTEIEHDGGKRLHPTTCIAFALGQWSDGAKLGPSEVQKIYPMNSFMAASPPVYAYSFFSLFCSSGIRANVGS